MEFLIVLAVLAIVVFVVTAPLRRTPPGAAALQDGSGAAERQLGELEAARDAKYREIRDADLDHQTGKLSDEDYQAVDRTLRAEAVEIMHAIDRARGGASPGSGSDSDPGAQALD